MKQVKNSQIYDTFLLFLAHDKVVPPSHLRWQSLEIILHHSINLVLHQTIWNEAPVSSASSSIHNCLGYFVSFFFYYTLPALSLTLYCMIFFSSSFDRWPNVDSYRLPDHSRIEILDIRTLFCTLSSKGLIILSFLPLLVLFHII